MAILVPRRALGHAGPIRPRLIGSKYCLCLPTLHAYASHGYALASEVDFRFGPTAFVLAPSNKPLSTAGGNGTALRLITVETLVRLPENAHPPSLAVTRVLTISPFRSPICQCFCLLHLPFPTPDIYCRLPLGFWKRQSRTSTLTCIVCITRSPCLSLTCCFHKRSLKPSEINGTNQLPREESWETGTRKPLSKLRWHNDDTIARPVWHKSTTACPRQHRTYMVDNKNHARLPKSGPPKGPTPTLKLQACP